MVNNIGIELDKDFFSFFIFFMVDIIIVVLLKEIFCGIKIVFVG